MPEIVSRIREEVLTESKLKEPQAECTKPKAHIPENNQVVHRGVTCDECGAYPIVGVRYKCVVCHDFDVCEKCEAKSSHVHPFLKIKKISQTPIKIFAVIDDQNESLEINGSQVPIPNIQDGINLLTGFLNGKPEECKESFQKCKEGWKKFARQMRHGHCPYFPQRNQDQEKVEPKVEQKVEQKVEAPKVEVPKVEVPKVEVLKVEAPKVENTQPIITEESSNTRNEVLRKLE